MTNHFLAKPELRLTLRANSRWPAAL
jgi:hypothetical protein